MLLAVLTSHLRALGAFVSKRYVSWRAAPRSADLVRMVITHALCTHAVPRTTPNTVRSGQDDVQARAKEEARHGDSGETHLHSVSRHAFDATLHVVSRLRNEVATKLGRPLDNLKNAEAVALVSQTRKLL